MFLPISLIIRLILHGIRASIFSFLIKLISNHHHVRLRPLLNNNKLLLLKKKKKKTHSNPSLPITFRYYSAITSSSDTSSSSPHPTPKPSFPWLLSPITESIYDYFL